ncbi:MAG: M48 family metalloprotease, partial [bacterium]
MNAFRPLFWLLLLSALACAHAADDPRAHADYYIDVFGEVDAGEDPLVARAYRIFEQVRSVAEDPIGFTPTLKVIDSDAQPWAVALPDGYLILSRGALDICYHGHNEARGDARLAFVLGHELAHLVSRDFWHRNVFLSLSGNFQNGGMGEVQDLVAGGLFDESEDEDDSALEDIKRKELHADDAGVLYASLAGYQT